jgi:hypothetical protein
VKLNEWLKVAKQWPVGPEHQPHQFKKKTLLACVGLQSFPPPKPHLLSVFNASDGVKKNGKVFYKWHVGFPSPDIIRANSLNNVKPSKKKKRGESEPVVCGSKKVKISKQVNSVCQENLLVKKTADRANLSAQYVGKEIVILASKGRGSRDAMEENEICTIDRLAKKGLSWIVRGPRAPKSPLTVTVASEGTYWALASEAPKGPYNTDNCDYFDYLEGQYVGSEVVILASGGKYGMGERARSSIASFGVKGISWVLKNGKILPMVGEGLDWARLARPDRELDVTPLAVPSSQRGDSENDDDDEDDNKHDDDVNDDGAGSWEEQQFEANFNAQLEALLSEARHAQRVQSLNSRTLNPKP